MNRYGTTANERLENERRANFELFLKGSPHWVSFLYETETIEAVFEPYRQNETKTLMYLLCRATQSLETGVILTIKGDRYMVYYLDEVKDTGYNRYIIVKMTHTLSWTAKDQTNHMSEVYLYFQEDNMLKQEVRSRSRTDTLYLENLKLNFLLMPLSSAMSVGTYLTIATKGIVQYFVVTGFDIVSTPGVMYTTIDPTYERDLTPPPVQQEGEPDSNFFWFKGE